MYRALIIDTETSNLPAKGRRDDFSGVEIVELAYLPADEGIFQWPPSPEIDLVCQRFRPEGPIDPGAMAAHHIIPQDVLDSPPSSAARLPECEYVIGHNVDFDAGVLGLPDSVRRICTLAMSKHVWGSLSSYKLSAIAYAIMPPEVARTLCIGAHTAGVDVALCRIIFEEICKAKKIESFESAFAYSEHCRVPRVFPFGKHEGTEIKLVPRDYLRWALANVTDLDPYLRKAIVETLAI